MFGYLFILWGLLISAYCIYLAVVYPPPSGVHWFLTFSNILGGLALSYSGWRIEQTAVGVVTLGGRRY